MIFKIKGAARSLFEIWIGQVKQCYPDYLFQAKDAALVDDLIIAFAKGLEFVWRNENKTKHNIPEWSVGAVLKKAATTLNTHWSQEYIYKQTHEYKDLCFLKALSQFLKVDVKTVNKIEVLYRHLIKKEVNILEPELEKKDKVIDLHQFKKTKKSSVVFKRNLTDYLDSIYYEKHFLVFGDILKSKSSLVLADFFNYDEIEKIIECVNSP